MRGCSLGRSVVLVWVAIVLAAPTDQTAHAGEPVTIAGTFWTLEGPLKTTAKKEKAEVTEEIGLFFGPQTVTTESGDVILGDSQYLMVLDDEGDQTQMVGSYTSKKKKAQLFAGPSADEFVIGLLEASFGPFEGTLSIQKFKVKAKFQSSNEQDTIDVKLKVKASVSGKVDGEPINGKTKFNFRGLDNRGTIRIPLVLHPVRNSEGLSTERTDEKILSLFSKTQEFWNPAGIDFDVTLEEVELSADLIELAEQNGVSTETFPIADAIPDPGKALHMFFLRFLAPKPGVAFAHPQVLVSAVADKTESFEPSRLMGHNLGHNLSLGHVSKNDALMSGAIGTTLSSDEILQARRSALDVLASFTAPWPPQKITFVTSSAYPGDLVGAAQALTACAGVSTGLEAGDCICQSEADDAGLTGTYKAWLSDSVESPNTRFQKSTGPYVVPQTDVPTAIALSYADVTDGALLIRPLSRTASGEVTSLNVAWTGTQDDGEAAGGGAADRNCEDWMPAEKGKGTVGEISSPSSPWSDKKNNSCSSKAALYCFEQ